jgi:hypothetical protein
MELKAFYGIYLKNMFLTIFGRKLNLNDFF